MITKLLDYNVALNYIGIQSPSESLFLQLDKVKEELFALSQPKQVFRVCNCKKIDGFYALEDTDIVLKSKNVNETFVSCTQIAVMAVTLGSAVDKKIEYYQKADINKCLMLDALASLYADNVMDDLESQVRKMFDNKFFTMRYSCGYGDLGLELQPKILNCLDATKRIGVVANDSCLMIPLKSITAFVGISDVWQKNDDICRLCNIHDCNGVCSKKQKRG
ncbi:MAG: vitamin B12 dependent-methionine synthase activation domain-containing protein [Clostridia bacterium]